MEKNRRGFRGYLIFMFILVAAVIILNVIRNTSVPYSYDRFISDMEAGKVEDISITPDQHGDTGYINVALDSGTNKKLYVTSVSDTEKMTL